MDQAIKIIPDYQRTVLMPSIRRPEDNLMPVDYGGDLEVIEVAEELNDAAKLKESSTFDTDIPYNTNNRWMVEKYGNSIPVLVNAHGLQLPDREIQVNGYSEQSEQYDVSFVRSQEWAEIFKTLALNEIDGFTPFQMSEAFIDDNQLNDAAYPDTGATPTRGFYTPLAYYGGLNKFNEANSLFELIYADYRLWFHYGKILEQCFFAAGWKMDCPFLLTPYGQRLAWLLVGGKVYDGYGASPGFLHNAKFKNKLQLPCSRHYAFRAEKTAAQVITGTQDPAWMDSELVGFQDDSTAPNFDNGAAADGGFYDATNEVIHGFTGKWRYRMRLKITGGAAPISALFGIVISDISGPVNYLQTTFYDPGGEVIGSDLVTITVPGGSVTVFMDFDVTVESVLAFRFISPAFLFGDGVGLTIQAGSTIEGNGEFIFITNNSTLPNSTPDILNETIVFPQSWLSPEIKAIEVLEDYCHRTNSKLYTDRARRIVSIYTEHDVPTYGVNTEPYYFDTVEQDLSLMQVENSAQVSLKDVVAPAKYILGFKETTDEYIASVQKDTPFDAVIDMAPYAENIDPDKTVENRSNLVEPSLEREFVEVRDPNPSNKPVSVMAVLDNMVGETSANTAPRTAYIYGLVKQRAVNGALANRVYKTRNGTPFQTKQLMAYATQFAAFDLVDTANVAVPRDKSLVYDHTEAVTEPMKRYWIDTVAILYTAQIRKLTVLSGSFNRFVQMNFRNLYRLKFMGLDWKGRIVSKRTKVNDHRRVELELREEKEC